jgi:hypothetical protein
MPEGYRATVAFSLAASVQLWERDVKPPGFDGGNMIDITTQFNNKYRTGFPQTLVKLDPISFVAAYDPDALTTILNTLLNAKTGSVTFWLPSGDSIDVYGYLQKFEPQELKIGEYPMAQCTVEITNLDPTTFTEQGPVYNAAAGT